MERGAYWSVREGPRDVGRTIACFQEAWADEAGRMVCDDLIGHAVGVSAVLPQSCLPMDGDRTTGCAGLATDDLGPRMGLCPWLVAPYAGRMPGGTAGAC